MNMAASPASSHDEPDCYFTAKAVPIRASIMNTSGLRVSTYSSSPVSPGSPHLSRSITPSQFPPPPGHSHPSYVFRRPLATVRDSTASSTYAPTPPADGRASTLSATPSLFPLPPSANGKDAHIRPLFTTRQSTALSTTSVPGPTPPPKEYHPTLSPLTYDYFSPPGPAPTSFTDPQPPAAAATTRTGAAGISRIARPMALDLNLNLNLNLSVGGGNDAPVRHSSISRHSPVSNPALTPLTLQTLSHLSNTALRSPSLTFVESSYSPGLSPGPSYAGSASPLTSAQKDRLWEMKRAYDEKRRRRGDGDGDEKGGWLTGRRRRKGGSRGSTRGFLWAVVMLGVLALAGIVGLIVGITLAQKGGG